MKKCKQCNGTGFTFDGREYKDDGWFGFRLVNKKEVCKKCFGRGAK